MKDERPPRRRPNREPTPPVATLGALLYSAERYSQPDWFWLCCTTTICTNKKAVRLADLIAVYGANASSDVVRKSGRCAKCGTKGAMLIAPSWVTTTKAWQAFPEASPVGDNSLG